MNISSNGESSNMLKENGDTSDTERPLKKARFAWEVKGKNCLRNESSDKTLDDSSNSENLANVADENKKDLDSSTEEHLEIIGDYLFKQDFHTLESVITDPERSLLTPCTRVSTEVVSYPRYVATHELNRAACSNIQSSSYQSVPMSSILSLNEDRCIARWQAGQMAKAFIDNSINRIIDVWSQVQLISTAEENDQLVHGVTNVLNTLPGDNNIENEGILMAISAHGLQNTSTSSSDTDTSSSSDDETNDTSPSHSESSPVETLEDIVRKNENSDVQNPSSLCDIAFEDNITDFNNEISRCDRLSYNLPILEYNQDENNIFSPSSDIFSNNHDFLDTAVSFAVQNKGLTSFGTEYG